MGSKVDVKATGNASKLLQTYDRVIRKQGKMISELRKTARAAKKGSEDAKQSTRQWASSIGSAVAGYASLTAAIGVATAALREQSEAAKLASESIAGIQESKAAAAFSAPTNIPRTEFFAFVEQEANRLNVPLREANRLAATVGSSAAGATPTQILNTVREALELRSRSSELEAASLGGAALDLLVSTGQQDPKAALGFLSKVGTQARIPSLSQLAAVAPGAIGNIAQIGGIKPEEAAELFAFITKQIIDPSGEQSANAAIGFAERLFQQPVIPRFDPAAAGGSGAVQFDFLANVDRRLAEGGTLTEVLTFVRERLDKLPAEFREEAFAKLNVGKGRVRAAIQGLVREREIPTKLFESIKQAIPAPGPELAAFVDDITQFIGEGEGFQLQQARNARVAALEAAQLNNPRGALAAEIRQALSEQRANLPQGFGIHPVSLLESGILSLTDQSPEAALAALRRLRASALGQSEILGTPVDEQRAVFERLNGLLDMFGRRLEALNDEARRQTDEMRKQTRIMDDPAGAATAASAVDVSAENN